MSDSEISILKPVDIRTVWPQEDRDFTPWLAQPEGLELLGSALGLTLAALETERAVGKFSADILCQRIEGGADTESRVVIENQYGTTDHDHLGKLLTYAAGLEARTVVWIAEEFNDEHRAALDLLNASTTSEFNYFGVAIKLLSIDESRPAPQFSVVVQPNDWAKTIQEEQDGGLSPTRQLQLEFWRGFRSWMDSESEIRCRQPHPSPYMWFGTGNSNFGVIAVFSGDNTLRVDLEIYGDQIQVLFDKLSESKSEIDGQAKQSYAWGPPDRGTRPRVYVQRSADIWDREEWPEYQQWFKVELERMFEFVVPRAKVLAA